MKTYLVTVKGTWSVLYDVIAISEEDALKQARNLVSDDVIKACPCPFNLTFYNFDSYIL